MCAPPTTITYTHTHTCLRNGSREFDDVFASRGEAVIYNVCWSFLNEYLYKNPSSLCCTIIFLYSALLFLNEYALLHILVHSIPFREHREVENCRVRNRRSVSSGKLWCPMQVDNTVNGQLVGSCVAFQRTVFFFRAYWFQQDLCRQVFVFFCLAPFHFVVEIGALFGPVLPEVDAWMQNDWVSGCVYTLYNTCRGRVCDRTADIALLE